MLDVEKEAERASFLLNLANWLLGIMIKKVWNVKSDKKSVPVRWTLERINLRDRYVSKRFERFA